MRGSVIADVGSPRRWVWRGGGGGRVPAIVYHILVALRWKQPLCRDLGGQWSGVCGGVMCALGIGCHPVSGFSAAAKALAV